MTRTALRLFAFLTALLCAVPVMAAGVSVTNLGTGTGNTPYTITTIANAPAGGTIIVVLSVGLNNVIAASVTDSAGNCTTYTALDNAGVASRPTSAIFYCANTASNLNSGGTITITNASGAGSATAFYVTGLTAIPADIHAKQVNGAGATTATTTSTGTLSQAYELVVGTLALGGTSVGFNPGNGFLSVGGVSNANGSAYTAFLLSCTTASVSFTPSWTTSRAYMSNVVSFKATAADSQCDTKTNAYSILQLGGLATQDASKVNMYAVLQYSSSMSKSNGYVILVPNGHQSLPFHVFP